MAAVAFDRSDPAFRADPYPTLARLQRETPVFETEGTAGSPVWYALLYEDVAALLGDPRLSARKFPAEALDALAADPASPMSMLARLLRGTLLALDPPDHTRLRNLVNRAFTPRRIEGLRSRVGALVEKRLAELAEREGCDLIADFAVPLPLQVIAELLGLPAGDEPQLKRWSDHLATLIDGSLREANLVDSMRAATELSEYVAGVVAERRVAPRDDLISALVQAQAKGDALCDDELLAAVALILGAGHETTTNLIGNGLLALLRHPAALAELRARPEILPRAVEELLRFDPPIQYTSRVVAESLVVRGVRLAKGQEINLHLAAANRDPAVFERPQELWLDRADNRQLGFGNGVHYCLGAALARMEGCIAIGAVLRHFPRLELADAPLRWRAGNILRGVEALPVRLHGGVARG